MVSHALDVLLVGRRVEEAEVLEMLMEMEKADGIVRRPGAVLVRRSALERGQVALPSLHSM